MTVVNPNSIAGINSITVQTGQALNIHAANGDLIRNITNESGISTYSGINITASGINVSSGVVTATTFSGTATKVDLNSNNDNTAFRVPFTSGNSGSVFLYADNADGMTYTPSSGTLSATSFVGSGANLTGLPAGVTINSNASTKFITGSNTANTLDCEANLSYNNSVVTFASSNLTINKSTNPTISVTETAGSKSGQFRTNTDGVLVRSLGNYPLIFHTNQSEKLRITSGGSVNINGDYTQSTYKLKVNAGNSYFDGNVTVGGVLSSAGGFSVSSGNVTIPANIFHDGDSNTYFGFSGADTFHVQTAGSERFRLESTGKAHFWIGNNDYTNPDIGGSTTGVSIGKNVSGQIYACVDDSSGDYYKKWTMNLCRRNNAGDGPQLALDRGGWVKASIAGLQGGSTASSGPGQFAIYTHAYNTGSHVMTERVRINSTGKVGIATDNPYAPLSVRTDPAASNAGNLADKGILLHAPGATDEQVIPISASFVTNAHLPRCAIGFISHPTADPVQGYAGEIGFYTRDGADGSAVNPADERLRITRSGDVVIGTTAAARSPLHIHRANADCYVHITNSTTGTGSGDGFTIHQSGVETLLNNRETGNMRLYTSGTERLRIDSDGHMGLGVTPNANWPSNGDFKALQIGSGTAVYGRGSGDQDRGGISVNYYHTGSAEKRIAAGNANTLYMVDGEFVFKRADSASADSTISWDTRCKINSEFGVKAENTCKAWLCYRGENGQEGILDDYNVATVSDESTGTFAVTFSRNLTQHSGGKYSLTFGSHNWSPCMLIAGVAYTSSHGSNNPWWGMEDNFVRVHTMRSDSNTLVDAEVFFMAVHGDTGDV